MTSYPTAVELFKQFVPKFSIVSLVRNRWGKEHDSLDHLFLRMRIGNKDSGPSSWNGEMAGFDYSSHLFFDIRASGMPISFQYDRESKVPVREQFDSLVASQIEELLNTRTFRIKLLETPTVLTRRFGFQEFRFTVVMDGEPILGLHLPEGGRCGFKGNWRVFIPDGTPEYNAIWTALEYERTLRRDENAPAREREEAKTSFDQALSAVAA